MALGMSSFSRILFVYKLHKIRKRLYTACGEQGDFGSGAYSPSRASKCNDSHYYGVAPLIVDLMTGSLVVEKIFAILEMYIGIMLVVDILYGIIDPRIRLAKKVIWWTVRIL